MAYRRRQGITRASTFKEEVHHQTNTDDDENKKTNANENGSLAARAIRASAAHRDSSVYGYAYASDPPSLPQRDSHHFSLSKGPFLSESTSTKETNDQKYGLWGILARKAKSILEEDDQFESSNRVKSQVNDTTGGQGQFSRQSSESGSRIDNVKLRKRLDAITSSLNHLGDTLGNAFEEGRTIVEHKTADIIQETRNKTADIIQETRKFQLRRRGGTSDAQDQETVLQNTSWQRPVCEPVQTHALKASRDVAMATAAKAKVLLRELKTVKADLAFAKERCSQLEEENKRLRESREKGDNPADDDLIRLQLETLLAEKARLAHENSIYARENRFLREIVEYHQLTMQDVVYLDEGAEEVTEVYPFSIDNAKAHSSILNLSTSPTFSPEVSSFSLPTEMKEHTEVAKDAFNATSLSCLSSPPKVCSFIYPPERTESLKIPTSPQRVADEEAENYLSSKPPLAAGEDPKTTPVSST